jgi:large subunit ribosomal protein L30e
LIDQKILSKALHQATKTGKCISGYKEVHQSIKGSKLVVYSTALSPAEIKTIAEECKAVDVPIASYAGKSFELGAACGKKYKISILAVKSPGEADLSPILTSLQGV